MKIIDLDINNIIELPKECRLCLGYFDGMHLGHQKLISTALMDKKPVAVMTFDISPNIFLKIKKTTNELMTLFDKAEFLKKMKVNYLIVIHFDSSFSNLSAEEFINLVLKKLNPKKIIVGEDYSFGLGGFGSPKMLEEHFLTTIVGLQQINNIKIASRNIEKFLIDGDIDKANEMLGRNYTINGLVVHGLNNGSSIEFPTANLDVGDQYVLPKDGVYIGYSFVHGRKLKSLICVGTHPTISELKHPIVEVHILNFSEPLYGREITVSFVKKIRDIFKFSNLDELKEQLNKDLTQLDYLE